MAKIFKLGFVLLVITAVTGLILGGVYTLTLEPIRIAKEKEKMEALAATLPGAAEFKQLEVENDPTGIIKEVNEGSKDGEVLGYNITVTPKGYGGPVEVVVGIANDGLVRGIKILSHEETPGLGAKAAAQPFMGQFEDKKAALFAVTKNPPASDEEISAISGATITSSAVVTGVNTAVRYWRSRIMGEGGAGGLDELDGLSGASAQ